MNGKKSEFEYDWFYDGTWGYNLFCVNKDKYTLEQAKASTNRRRKTYSKI